MYNPEEYRFLKDQLIEIYSEKGKDKLREFCVLASIPFTAAFTLILEEHEDNELSADLDRLRQFYRI